MFKKHWLIQGKRVVRDTGAGSELAKLGIAVTDPNHVPKEQGPKIKHEMLVFAEPRVTEVVEDIHNPSQLACKTMSRLRPPKCTARRCCTSPLTLDEWKAQRQQRAKPQFNIGKAGEGEDVTQWKKMIALNNKKKVNSKIEGDSEEELEYDPSMCPQRVGRLQRVFDKNLLIPDLVGLCFSTEI